MTRNYGNIPGYFEVSAVSTQRSPMDCMIGDCNRNFMTYYKERYNLEIKNSNQPLLQVEQLPKNIDMLQSNKNQRLSPVSKAYSNASQISVVNTEIYDLKPQAKVIEFIPEFCKMSVVPASAWKILACVPSILWRMESILLAEEVANKIQTATIPDLNSDILLTANNVFTMTILQALTLAKACDQFNLERLEFLGDSFLKFAIATYLFRSYTNFHEGQLTTISSRFVSNENLCQLGIKLGLPGYIICRKVNHDDSWIPPGYCIKMEEGDCMQDLKQKLTELGTSRNSPTKPVQKLTKKSIADVMEALLAASLLQLGEIPAYRFITMLNAEIKFDQLPNCVTSLNGVQLQQIDELYRCYKLMEVEAVLDYKFNHRILLLSALTHASYNHPQIAVESYQRLEFLGDAILQYITARDNYHANTNYTPADLHDLKEASLKNESLAALTVVYGFHKYLFQRSPTLFHDIHQFLNIIDSKVRQKLISLTAIF